MSEESTSPGPTELTRRALSIRVRADGLLAGHTITLEADTDEAGAGAEHVAQEPG